MSLRRRGPAELIGGRRDYYAGSRGSIGAMFLFFSNRLGCLGSLLVSIAATVVLLLLLNVI
jgi:hypothetical protein